MFNYAAQHTVNGAHTRRRETERQGLLWRKRALACGAHGNEGDRMTLDGSGVTENVWQPTQHLLDEVDRRDCRQVPVEQLNHHQLPLLHSSHTQSVSLYHTLIDCSCCFAAFKPLLHSHPWSYANRECYENGRTHWGAVWIMDSDWHVTALGRNPTLQLARPQPQQLDRRQTFSVAGPLAWNSLPDFIRDPTCSTDCFRRLLKTYLLGMSGEYAIAAYFAGCRIFQQSAHFAYFFRIHWHFDGNFYYFNILIKTIFNLWGLCTPFDRHKQL